MDWDNYLHLLYNSGSTPKIYNLSTTMTDVEGNSYSDNVTIEPWDGLILMGYGAVDEGENLPTSSGLGVSNAGNLLVDKNGRVIIIQ